MFFTRPFSISGNLVFVGRISFQVLILFILAVWFLAATPLDFIYAQTAAEINQRLETELQAELAQVEKEIEAQTKLLRTKQEERASIERDIDILTFQINTAKLNIRAKQIEIQRLGDDINSKQKEIGTLSSRIDRGKESLSELLRKKRGFDELSWPEIVLAEGSIATLFSELDSLSAVEGALHQSFETIRLARTETEETKGVLERRRRAELDAQQVIERQKRLIETKEAEKKILLAASKNQERAYQTILAERETERRRITSALFRLRGVEAISFGEAFSYATRLEKVVGVRPSFLMAILTQESNLGQNVGTCNRPGDPPSKNWQKIMKPSRDHAPFLEITASLSLDPNIVPLSCPAAGGWGGAMGPAQFIPSTWMLYRDRIARATGVTTPNPWNPEHAFTASALLLADLGASRGGYSAERESALRYYAGANWSKPANAFYGNEVMKIAANYQLQIDRLQNL